jgi:hypothetical protein
MFTITEEWDDWWGPLAVYHAIRQRPIKISEDIEWWGAILPHSITDTEDVWREIHGFIEKQEKNEVSFFIGGRLFHPTWREGGQRVFTWDIIFVMGVVRIIEHLVDNHILKRLRMHSQSYNFISIIISSCGFVVAVDRAYLGGMRKN